MGDLAKDRYDQEMKLKGDLLAAKTAEREEFKAKREEVKTKFESNAEL